MTDLVPVCLGLGVFLANSTVRERSTTLQNFHYFQINRHGYLPSRIPARAALFAFVRGEEKPGWIALSGRMPPCRAVRGCATAEDERYAVHRPRRGISRSHSGSPKRSFDSVRVGDRGLEVLWEVPRLGPASNDLVAGVVGCLDEPDTDLRVEAARAIAHLGPSAQRPCPRCCIF